MRARTEIARRLMNAPDPYRAAGEIVARRALGLGADVNVVVELAGLVAQAKRAGRTGDDLRDSWIAVRRTGWWS